MLCGGRLSRGEAVAFILLLSLSFRALWVTEETVVNPGTQDTL